MVSNHLGGSHFRNLEPPMASAQLCSCISFRRRPLCCTHSHIRLPQCLQMQILTYSGNEGVFIEPRGLDGRSPSPLYQVLWLPRQGFEEICRPWMVLQAWLGSGISMDFDAVQTKQLRSTQPSNLASLSSHKGKNRCTWSPGPLCFCVPEGSMSPEAMSKWNLDHKGSSMVVASGSNTHFMNGSMFLQVLEQCYSEAFKIQRQRLLYWIYLRGPVPFGTLKQSLSRVFESIRWSARPLQPQPAATPIWGNGPI